MVDGILPSLEVMDGTLQGLHVNCELMHQRSGPTGRRRRIWQVFWWGERAVVADSIPDRGNPGALMLRARLNPEDVTPELIDEAGCAISAGVRLKTSIAPVANRGPTAFLEDAAKTL
jgi:hypothetical protein